MLKAVVRTATGSIKIIMALMGGLVMVTVLKRHLLFC